METKRIFLQVCHAVRHCHRKGIIHRDIKLDNVLLDDEDVCKLCDFGVSRKISSSERISEQCGTPAYLAPEIVRDQGYSGFKADVWSLGVLLFVLSTGKMPFRAATVEELNSAILIGKFEFPKHVDLGEDLKDLIAKMLVVDVGNRISSAQVYQHRWCRLEQEESLSESTQKGGIKRDSNIHGKDSINLSSRGLTLANLQFSKGSNFENSKNEINKNSGEKERVSDSKSKSKSKSKKFANFLSRGIKRDRELLEASDVYEHSRMAYLEQPKNRWNQFVLKRLQMKGFSMKNITKSLDQKLQNHISACYYTLERDYL